MHWDIILKVYVHCIYIPLASTVVNYSFNWRILIYFLTFFLHMAVFKIHTVLVSMEKNNNNTHVWIYISGNYKGWLCDTTTVMYILQLILHVLAARRRAAVDVRLLFIRANAPSPWFVRGEAINALMGSDQRPPMTRWSTRSARALIGREGHAGDAGDPVDRCKNRLPLFAPRVLAKKRTTTTTTTTTNPGILPWEHNEGLNQQHHRNIGGQ